VIVRVANARNVNILGGVIEGERNDHLGSEGQWGMGISLLNAQDVVVEGVTVRDCWGDGFYVGGATGCSNITFCRVTADRNRRQGLSIVNAVGVVVLDSTFKNTSGTDPQCGVDLEPNAHQTVKGVRIRRCTFTNNAGGGMWGGPAYEDRHVTTLTDSIIENCTFTGNGARLSNGAVVGFAACSGNTIRNNLITGNLGAGIQLRSEALNHLVTGNIVTGTQGDGILLEDCADSIVTGNTVTGNSGHGIKGARGHGATLGENTVSANGRTP
jgi:parallel beta-helix repeat protein